MLSSVIQRQQLCFDEGVQPVEIHVAKDGGYYASNALGNFCFDVTLSYRRLERPRRVTDGV
jgi:hypothetical protein